MFHKIFYNLLNNSLMSKEIEKMKNENTEQKIQFHCIENDGNLPDTK